MRSSCQAPDAGVHQLNGGERQWELVKAEGVVSGEMEGGALRH
jgi:hypothetical protein